MIKELINKKEKICVVGLGYVGLPLAVEFSKKLDVIGFDKSIERISELKNGIDSNKQVMADLKQIEFTSDAKAISKAKFIIVAVPTPVDEAKNPDFTPLISASELIGDNLERGSIVVYESTVYPGATEEICLPILEERSKLQCPDDFLLGYSPERINPNDPERPLTQITKIVSGINEKALEIIEQVYGLIIKANLYKAESIKVAEAAKVVENTQRDVNIAFANEIARICDALDIRTEDVFEAASTKWNFIKYKPGLVGGHCISVDPYYLAYIAEKHGYNAPLIQTSRTINEGMADFIVSKIEDFIEKRKMNNEKLKVGVLGITYKANCPDLRNSKSAVIVDILKQKNFSVVVYDPVANIKEVNSKLNIKLCSREELKNLNVVIIAVEHDCLKKEIDENVMSEILTSEGECLVIDIPRLLPKKKQTFKWENYSL